MENTSTPGFYKLENGNLFCATKVVDAPAYTLIAENKDDYTYPVDGWHWFNSEEEAYISFGIPNPVQPSPSEP